MYKMIALPKSVPYLREEATFCRHKKACCGKVVSLVRGVLSDRSRRVRTSIAMLRGTSLLYGYSPLRAYSSLLLPSREHAFLRLESLNTAIKPK